MPLSELFDIRQGKSLSPKHREGKNPKPFLRTANVYWGRIDLKTVDTMDFTENEVEQFRLKAGDLLVCEGGDIGRTALWNGGLDDCCYQNHLHRLRPTREDVYPNFYAFWMQAAYQVLNLYGGYGNKTTIPNLSQARLKTFGLPLPPFPEQRTIAAILSKIQQAIETQEKIIERTKELKKSLMAKLFTEGLHGEELKETEIGLMPRSWEVVKLGDLFKLSSGSTRPSDLAETLSEKHPYPVYGGNGILGYSQSYFMTEPTLILGRVGVYCGNAYVTNGKCWISDNALYTKAILSEFDLLYMCEFLRFYDLNRFRHMGGQPLITQGIVHERQVPMPSFSEQAEIARALSTVSCKISTAENKKLKLQHVFKSMLHQLMTGQIRVNNIELPFIGERTGAAHVQA